MVAAVCGPVKPKGGDIVGVELAILFFERAVVPRLCEGLKSHGLPLHVVHFGLFNGSIERGSGGLGAAAASNVDLNVGVPVAIVVYDTVAEDGVKINFNVPDAVPFFSLVGGVFGGVLEGRRCP